MDHIYECGCCDVLLNLEMNNVLVTSKCTCGHILYTTNRRCMCKGVVQLNMGATVLFLTYGAVCRGERERERERERMCVLPLLIYL